MKRFFTLLVVIMAIISGCSKKQATITGNFTQGTEKSYIYLSKIEIDQSIFVDSAKISNNNFRFKVDITDPTFFMVGTSDNEFVTILAEPGEKVSLKFNSKTPNRNYTVSGSEGSANIQKLDNDLLKTNKTLDSLVTVYSDMLTNNADPKAISDIEELYTKTVKDQRMKNIKFIIENTHSFASVYALYQQYEDQQYVLYDNKDLQYIKIVTDTLSKYHPNSKIVSAMKADLERGTQALISQQVNRIIQSEDLGEAVIDPNLLDSNGKRVSLSSLRGKYVLLDFFSFNSTDCVANNEDMKQLYKIYHKKGFEIYQINIDESEDEWRQYISYEDIPWISLREDDPYYLENARLFNVRTLPANYLFDTKGNIIASNLFGRNLRIKLDQIFN